MFKTHNLKIQTGNPQKTVELKVFIVAFVLLAGAVASVATLLLSAFEGLQYD